VLGKEVHSEMPCEGGRKQFKENGRDVYTTL